MKIDKGIVNTINEFMNLSPGAVFAWVEDKGLYLRLAEDPSIMFNAVNLKTNKLFYIKPYETVVEIDAKLVGDNKTQKISCCSCDNEDDNENDYEDEDCDTYEDKEDFWL